MQIDGGDGVEVGQGLLGVGQLGLGVIQILLLGADIKSMVSEPMVSRASPAETLA